MSYEEQLSAARFKAERDRARQELDSLNSKIDELCSENGVAPCFGGSRVEMLENLREKISYDRSKADSQIAKLENAYDMRGKVIHDNEERIHELKEAVKQAMTTSPNAQRLLQEDEDAAKWVREHGGLEKVEARLMPKGMEWLLEVWPKWSNGEYCKFGDWWTADKYGDYEPRQLRRLVFYTPEQLREWEQDEGDNFGYEWDFMRPSDTTYRPDKSEPPAPNVLDADGVPIHEGDTVYFKETGEPITVVNPFTTRLDQCHTVECDDGFYSPEKLTHTKPEPTDSWKRLEEDAGRSTCEYFDQSHGCGNCPHYPSECSIDKDRDLVSRCKALAVKEGDHGRR